MLFFFFWFSFLFRTTPVAYGTFWARGQIGSTNPIPHPQQHHVHPPPPPRVVITALWSLAEKAPVPARAEAQVRPSHRVIPLSPCLASRLPPLICLSQ